jgi:opacity protein-like surface antigen
MNRKIVLAATAIAALLGRATIASADSTPGYYVSGDGGASLLPNLELKDTPSGTLHEDFNTGYAMGGAVGYDTGQGTRFEVDSSYQLSGLNKLGGAPATGHLDSTSLMVDGQVDLTHQSQITPYLGAGAGFQNIGASIDGLHDHDWKPAYQAEAGLRDDVSDKVSLFGEYRLSQSEAADLSDGGVTAHQHFADSGLLAGLTYHLGQ